MRTVLVLAQHPALSDAIRAGLNPETYRVVHRVSVEAAEPLLHQGQLRACILDVESSGVQGMWMIEKIRRLAPACPLLVYTGGQEWEWEEEAYLHGVAHFLAKPVRPRMLAALLERSSAKPHSPSARPSVSTPPPPAWRAPEPATNAAPIAPNVFHALEVLRNFSTILTHSLDAEALIRQFLLLLREIVGVNRAAIFLREPVASFGARDESRHLRKGCAIGLPAGLLEHFELSFEAGIGGHLFRSGRILRRYSEEARQDPEIQQEFEVLGAQVAIPILDRETLVGVAVFDGRLTGDPLLNGELELIFHLLEELGLAVKNIWLHDQLAANHEMMADTFRQLSSACVVVSHDLMVLHANRTARSYFSKSSRRNAELEFSDLPQALGSKVYQVLKTGTAIAPFKYKPEESPGSVYNVSIVPFQKQDSALPASALLMVEDLTQSVQLQKLEIEAANLRLVNTIADRLAHEIGNAMVPLATHHQLLKDRYKDPEFRASLEVALGDGVKRVTRLINQMRFLARDASIETESFPMANLIQDAYQEAQKHQPTKTAKLDYENGSLPIMLEGDRAALKHALAEVMLNALQANPSDPRIAVRMHAEGTGGGQQDVQIEIQDNGSGFASDTEQSIPSPFFTTRNVGLGLGLTVSRKIIETHHGKLEIVNPQSGQSGLVRITLPRASESAR